MYQPSLIGDELLDRPAGSRISKSWRIDDRGRGQKLKVGKVSTPSRENGGRRSLCCPMIDEDSPEATARTSSGSEQALRKDKCTSAKYSSAAL